MKNTFKTLSCSLALGLTAVAAPAVWAAENPVMPMAQAEPEILFEVKAFTLNIQVDILTQKTRAGVLEILATGVGPKSSMRTLQATIERAQKYLDQIAPGAFVLGLPTQTFDDSADVQVSVKPVLNDVKVVGVTDEDAKKVLASLPATLQKGTVMTDGNWPSAAVLSMFNHHPLKITSINYQINRDQPVTAVITVSEPAGKSQSAVVIDSYGNDVIGRGLMTVSHVQSDVLTLDDTFSIAVLASLKQPTQVGAANLRYSFTDAPALTQHAVALTHSVSNVETPFLSFGNLIGQGRYSELSYRQTRYLDCCQSIGLSNARFFVDLALNRSDALTKYESAVLVDNSVSTLPLTVGLEGLLQSSPSDKDSVFQGFSALVKGQLLFNQMGALGLSGKSDFDKSRFGADSSETLRISVDSRTNLDQLQLSAQLTTQYTERKLLPSGQMSIAGDRNGVRGFVNAALLGDTAAVLRLSADPLSLQTTWMNYSIQPYAFYDVGQKRGGNDERTLTVSSAGLGMRVSPLELSGLSLDAFAAQKLRGSDLDLLPGSSLTVDPVTYWVAGTYRF